MTAERAIPCTVAILTRNNAATLPRALQSVKDFDDILVCDGGSTDETREIARARGARVVAQPPEFLAEAGGIKDFAAVRNVAAAGAAHPWILHIDSDEAASVELVAEIRAFLAESPRPAASRIPACIVLDGTRIARSSNYPGYQIRFFHKEAGTYQKPIHERFVPHPGVPVKTFSAPWLYFVDSATAKEEFERDLVRDLPLFAAQRGDGTLGRRFRGGMRCARTILVVLTRGVRNNLLHRGPSTYPLYLELMRVRYQWEVIKVLLGARPSV